MSSRIRLIFVTVAIWGQVLPCNVMATIADSNTTTAKTVFVPAILGASTKDAEAAMEAVGLQPRFVLGPAATASNLALTVSAQQPEAGATLGVGAPVALTIYSRLGAAGDAPNSLPPQPELSEVRATPSLDKGNQTIDPRSGQLYLAETDLSVAAGAISLDVTRHLQMLPAGAALVGTRWRLNWEDRLFRSAGHAVIESEGRQQVFIWDDTTKRYSSGASDYIEREAGRSIWVKTKERIRNTFDELGRLVERDAANGNKVTLTYDSHGQLAKITGPKGVWLDLRSDASGRLAKIESSNGSTVHYSYSSRVNSPTVHAGSPALRYSYNENGALARIEHPRYGATQFDYDSAGRVTCRTWADSSREQFAYDDVARTVRHTDPSGNVTTKTWSEDQRTMRIATPLGHTTVVECNEAGRAVAMTGPTGQTARFTYDDLGRTAAIHNPATGTTRLEYLGDTELLTAAIEPGGGRTSLEYDSQGNLLRMTNSIDPTQNATFEYTPEGQIKSLVQGNGTKQTITYDSAGRIETVADAAGNTQRFLRDLRGNVVEETDPLGGVTKHTYDDQNRVTSITDPIGAKTQFAYEQRGRLYQVTMTDPRGGVTRSVYDQRGRLVSVTDPAKRTTRHTYDASGRLLSTTDPAGETSQYEYDADGRLTNEINPLGGVIKRTYDASVNVTSEIDPSGATTLYEYSPVGLLTRQVDSSGVVTSFRYDSQARRIEETVAGTQTTQYGYAGAERIAEMIPPSGPIQTFEHDPAGKLIAERHGEKTIATYEYDTLGRRTKEKQAGGLEVSYRYDAVGNVIAWQDNQGGSETTAYDAAGRPIARTDATGATTKFSYDPAGNLIQTTDPLGRMHAREYDAVGELAAVTEPNGDKARYVYDAVGRLATVHHPGGGTTSYEYDALGNTVKVVDPAGSVTHSNYDLAGRLVSVTDAKGQTTEFAYDAAGRQLEKRLADGKIIRNTYDDRGRLIKVDDGKFPVVYSYDDNDKVTRIEYPAIKRTLSYEFNDAGLKTKFVNSEGQTIEYEYDDSDRLVAMKLADGKAIKFAYDARDRLTSTVYPNGIQGNWTYNANGQITKLIYKNAAGKTIAGWSYSYDAAGNRTQTVEEGGRTIRYAYDPSGQLAKENAGDGKVVKYTYLPGGNRKAKQTAGGTVDYRYDKADRLLAAGDETFAYDANGNLIESTGEKGSVQYTHDGEDRLTDVKLPSGEHVRYRYAPTGERIARDDGKGETLYVTDGTNLLAELGSDLTAKAEYVHGPGMDCPLMMIRDGKMYFFHADQLGSIARITDQNGEVTGSYLYDGFGQMQSDVSDVANPFTYTAREFDPSTGLYYYRARNYDPRHGRFLSHDPMPGNVSQPRTWNPYLYVLNNPTRYIDPSGLEPADIPGLSPYYPVPKNWYANTPDIVLKAEVDRLKEDVGRWKNDPLSRKFSEEKLRLAQREVMRRGANAPRSPVRAGGGPDASRLPPPGETVNAPAPKRQATLANEPPVQRGNTRVNRVQEPRKPGNLLAGGKSSFQPPSRAARIGRIAAVSLIGLIPLLINIGLDRHDGQSMTQIAHNTGQGMVHGLAQTAAAGAVGAAVGSIVPGVGTALGAVGGMAIFGVYQTAQTLVGTAQRVIDKIREEETTEPLVSTDDGIRHRQAASAATTDDTPQVVSNPIDPDPHRGTAWDDIPSGHDTPIGAVRSRPIDWHDLPPGEPQPGVVAGVLDQPLTRRGASDVDDILGPPPASGDSGVASASTDDARIRARAIEADRLIQRRQANASAQAATPSQRSYRRPQGGGQRGGNNVDWRAVGAAIGHAIRQNQQQQHQQGHR
jgi:RHS repeat-associated protein